MAGLRAARAAGVCWVEFDVRLTIDGRCILLHDDTIDRTTDGTGAAADLSLAELAVWDAGGWFAPEFSNERVPTLEEAIDLLSVLGLGANIEIKANPGEERETGRVVGSLLAAAWPLEAPQPLISSFAPESLAGVRDVAPDLARGLLLGALDENWHETVHTLGCSTVHCDHAHLTRYKARDVAAAGLPLLSYTVNHAGRAEELWSWGVAAVFSDMPNRLLETAGALEVPEAGFPAALDVQLPSPRVLRKPHIAGTSLPRDTAEKLGPGV